MDLEFIKIIGDIYRLEFPFGMGTTSIFLVDGNRKVLIDSGSKSDDIENYLISALDSKGLGLKDVDILCNTHTHGDHIGGHKKITEASTVKVACYIKSVPKLAEPLKYSKLIRAVFPEHSPLPPARLDGVKTDIVLEEGQLLDNRLEVIFTPGHDTDTVCFYDRKTSTLITGDSLQGNGTVSQGIALYMNLEQYRISLRKLMERNIENIVTSHQYLITGDKAIGREKVKEYLNKCWEITCIYDEYIKGKLKKRENDLAEIAKGLINHMGNVEPEKLFLPLYTVKAHLDSNI